MVSLLNGWKHERNADDHGGVFLVQGDEKEKAGAKKTKGKK